MATINFMYRSTKESSFLNLRLLFRHNGKDCVIGGKTRHEVSKDYWSKYHFKKSLRDIDLKNLQTDTNTELNKIENHIIKAFHKENPNNINKEWLNKQIDLYYNPPTVIELPKKLLKYFDLFLGFKANEIKQSSIKKYRVVRNLIEKFEKSINHEYLIAEVNSDFKKRFEDYCISNGYSYNTIEWSIRTIKTVCHHASDNGVSVSNQLSKLKSKKEKTNKVYLTTQEIELIKNLDESILSEYLLNARDWLLISCYTGQRVSDFMRFTKKDIRIEKEKPLLEFTQQKTGKKMTIPVLPQVKEILQKRNGNFPRPISSQKYNSYIKTVCKIAKLNDKTQGSKLVKIEEDTRFPYRKEGGIFEKWELVTSHIGRRSFATNFYGQIPTSFLIYMTGHSTEQMFLNYIGKSNKDLAIEMINYF